MYEQLLTLDLTNASQILESAIISRHDFETVSAAMILLRSKKLKMSSTTWIRPLPVILRYVLQC